MATFSRRFDADHPTLSALRRSLRAWLETDDAARIPAAASVGDIDLLVTELAANVIDHSASPWVGVTVTSAGSGLTIEVSQSGAATGLPPTAAWGTLVDGDRGHGLRIVQALCDEVTIVHSNEAVAVRCRMLS